MIKINNFIFYENDLIDKLQNQIKELKEENKTLKELNVCVGCDNNPDYKKRLDKAIEYIEENTENINRDTYYEDYVETYDLLKILKGEE